MDFPIKNGDFPSFFVCLPEGNRNFAVTTSDGAIETCKDSGITQESGPSTGRKRAWSNTNGKESRVWPNKTRGCKQQHGASCKHQTWCFRTTGEHRFNQQTQSGWWFGTWLVFFHFFPSYWECHDPNWRSPSFFRGVGWGRWLNHQPAMIHHSWY